MDYNSQNNIETKCSNTMLYITIAILVVSLGFNIYTYLSYDMVKKGDLKGKYVKIAEIEFEMLPSYVQDNYIEKYKYNSQVDNLQNQISQLKDRPAPVCEPEIVEKIVTKVQKCEPKVVEKIVTKIEKSKPKIIEKVVTKVVKVEVVKKIDKTKYNTYRCFDMDNSGINPSKSCIDKLHKFLDKNKDAKLFEVIGIVDNSEFSVLKKAKDAKIADDKRIEKLSKLAQIGLSNQRVEEGIWAIKKYLGKDAPTQVVNYTVDLSTSNKKGFIIRAY